MKGKFVAVVAAVVVVAGVLAWVRHKAPIYVGAIYPTSGGQGPGGLEEYRGVELAAALANSQGGVKGRPINIHLQATESADGAPQAVSTLVARGAQFILGSYGSTISFPAAQAAYNRGRLFWETGAVGDLGMLEAQQPPPYLGNLVFRFPPAGTVLGRSAVDFVASTLKDQLPARPLTYSVAYVDDAYGSEVAAGALGELSKLGLALATKIPYDLKTADYAAMAAQIAASHTDVLFVASYINDAVSLRQQILAQHVPLVASIGTSSSYCLPEFGQQLGTQAVGLFASDKPDGDILKTSNLTPDAARALAWARGEYTRRYGGDMSAAALTGVAGAWALFHDVMPAATALTPAAVASAAEAADLPMGALPNGSGLSFGKRGTVQAGENLNALSVIWEWTAPNDREIVYPPAYATSPIKALPVTPAA